MKTTIKIIALLALAVLMLNACGKDEGTAIPEKYKVEFSPVKPLLYKPSPKDNKFFVIAKVNDKEISSGDEVEEGKEVVFTVHIGTLALKELDKWEVTGADVPNVNRETLTIKVQGPLKVVAVFKPRLAPK
ncbi:MAG: hypothetical protein ACOX5T_09260 [Candidatus Cryptobacteroides sp.]|jgi:hypothetical protein